MTLLAFSHDDWRIPASAAGGSRLGAFSRRRSCLTLGSELDRGSLDSFWSRSSVSSSRSTASSSRRSSLLSLGDDELDQAWLDAVNKALGEVDVVARVAGIERGTPQYRTLETSLEKAKKDLVSALSRGEIKDKHGSPLDIEGFKKLCKRARLADMGTLMLGSFFDDFVGYFLPAVVVAAVSTSLTLAVSPIAGVVAGAALLPLQWYASAHMHHAAHQMSGIYHSDRIDGKARPRFSAVPRYRSKKLALKNELKAHGPAQVGFRFAAELPFHAVRIALAAAHVASGALAPLGAAAVLVGTCVGPIASPLSNALAVHFQAKANGRTMAPLLGIRVGEDGQASFDLEAFQTNVKRLEKPAWLRSLRSVRRMFITYKRHYWRALRDSWKEGITKRKALVGLLGSNVPGGALMAPIAIGTTAAQVFSPLGNAAYTLADRSTRIVVNASSRACSRDRVDLMSKDKEKKHKEKPASVLSTTKPPSSAGTGVCETRLRPPPLRRAGAGFSMAAACAC